MFSIHQTISLAPALDPKAAALLDEEELAHYNAHAKPRFAVYAKARCLQRRAAAALVLCSCCVLRQRLDQPAAPALLAPARTIVWSLPAALAGAAAGV